MKLKTAHRKLYEMGFEAKKVTKSYSMLEKSNEILKAVAKRHGMGISEALQVAIFLMKEQSDSDWAEMVALQDGSLPAV